MSDPIDSLLTEKANAAFLQASAKVLRLAKQTGTPVIIWDHDRVRAVPPDEFPELEARLAAASAQQQGRVE